MSLNHAEMLAHIALTSELLEQIILEQRQDPEEIPHIRKILNEAHHSKLSIHPGSNKMYHDLRHLYWWSNMKQDITRHVTECDTSGRVKADHMRTPGYLQPLPVPVWKWEDISMDFIVGLNPHVPGL